MVISIFNILIFNALSKWWSTLFFIPYIRMFNLCVPSMMYMDFIPYDVNITLPILVFQISSRNERRRPSMTGGSWCSSISLWSIQPRPNQSRHCIKGREKMWRRNWCSTSWRSTLSLCRPPGLLKRRTWYRSVSFNFL